MKKTLLSLILALILLCAAAFAESDYTYYPESEEYVGLWFGGDYMLSIEHSQADENLFYCLISYSDSDDSAASWEYDGCAYDEISGGLSCEQIGVHVLYTFQGDETQEDVIFDDGAAAFVINEDGDLVWTDFKQAPDEADVVFARMDEELLTEMYPEMAYEGTWVADRATLVIEDLDDVIYATVYWSSSVSEVAVWEYTDLMYDEVADELNCLETGVMSVLVYSEDGEIASSEVLYDDGAAAFKLTENDTVIWTDYKKTPGENQVEFERSYEAEPVPEAGEFVEGYYQVIAGIETGTAGASLKQAQAAAQVTFFAAEYGLWDPDVEAVRAEMLAGWEMLTDEERAAFDANFMDVVTLIDSCLNDWEANQGLFEDAGVAGEMEMLVFDPLNRLAWENLCAYTLTLGNSDGE